ncbi:hypothetical protein VB779_09465 [Haloarculaceae archaeon H-GB11]|nr:hypothetical protein [Haloarculaceae archaeon H-GB11]
MKSVVFPDDIPVCTDAEEKTKAYEQAKNEQRPFLAVTDEDDMPGWRAVYNMDPTGEDRDEWYILKDSAVQAADNHREQYEQYIQEDCVIEGCSEKEGGLHGLDKTDAKQLANLFADVVWDTNNWAKWHAKDAFDVN